MKLVFVSNYFNHHQKPVCDAFSQRCESFFFISSAVMREERRQLGYGIDEPPYVIHGYEASVTERAKNLIKEADVVIVGAAQGEFLSPKLYRGKTVFYYSERLFKKPPKTWQLPLKAIKYYFRFMYRQNSYLLCSGAYTSADFARTHTFQKRCLKWGYFPVTKQYVIADLLREKDQKKLLWCGRLLDWKHPEHAVEIARRLHADGIDFSMDIIGDGNERERLSGLIKKYRLGDRVKLLGALKHIDVREHMEKAGVFLFTSDRQEGWGAVLNEAMNSGCAVVAGDAAGSVPWLIGDCQYGRVFRSGDVDMLYRHTAELLRSGSEQQRLGAAAYKRISQLWNAQTAAQRFLKLAESAIKNGKVDDVFENGPCSRAELLGDN